MQRSLTNAYRSVTSPKRHSNAKLTVDGYQGAQAPNAEIQAAAARKRAKRMERNWKLQFGH